MKKLLGNSKILVLTFTIVLVAAGCSKSQPQASSRAGLATGAGHGRFASSTRSSFAARNFPPGSKPFYGTVASVSGSKVTITGHSHSSSSTIITIIEITSGTQFKNGSKADITNGARVAGAGTANSDGSINAIVFLLRLKN
jgi:hypothetical protein